MDLYEAIYGRRDVRSFRPDPVPDEVWEEAARHYSEPQLAALVLSIATINAFNRLNAATRQPSGDWVERIIEGARQPA